ncbi:hypothetical protein [Sporosarcina newyorkensis]|uniref:hypothetical protein n=1 Tax=Sporosarcina newyorkensis TaxID=759851 RepID=UPI003CFDBA12
MENFTCTICATDLTTESIQIEKMNEIDVAFIICHECENRFNLMFDNKKTKNIKNKIKKIKEIENYLQLVLYREMLIVEDDYYKQAYDDLPQEEKDLIGGYQSNVDKQKIKEYNKIIKEKRFNFKDLLELL